MSRPRSESVVDSSDPLRPSDHVDGAEEITSPKLGPIGWIRWAWRQLTSMRTALVLLLLLAIAAVPGSIVPQRSADPNGVTNYFTDNPTLAPVLDKMQLFDVYSSAWFSAIYILLFISLIGCVIPRVKHHLKALRSRPPRTPARLGRLGDHRESLVELAPGTDAAAAASHAIDIAAKQLKAGGYRVERYDARGAFSISAERGYLRETGNLLFHIALLGVLLAVGIGGGFAYTGQRVIVQGTTFVNSVGTDYSSFNPGRFVDPDALLPYTLKLDKFDVSYQPIGSGSQGQAGDFIAHLTTQLPGQKATDAQIRVNHPLTIGGDRVYLLGNGYAPTVTVKNAAGDVVFHDSIAFLPQDNNLTSLGIIKVPDGLSEQLGMLAFFYPTQVKNDLGAFTSGYPALLNPVLSLNVYSGDLGINNGIPRSVYALDTTGMTQLTGGQTGVDSIELQPGQTADLPNGLGTITFDDQSPVGATDATQSVKRFVSLSIHRDVAGPWVLSFAVLAVLSLMLALFVPRRRMWVKATPSGSVVTLEYAGLARGEDPTLGSAVEALAAKHGEALESDGTGAGRAAAEPVHSTDPAEPAEPGDSSTADPAAPAEPGDSSPADPAAPAEPGDRA
ncbi:cytochrome c biogenesis protein ResB [Microbacterium protaetiae]|uniref:Cytochrome c biogenesis protein ResB n=1 Tax=Microbacterium protaetiae TaxID=2509458 RepID=A0A4P6EF40_9MICO|nr:cytochrome c biogenesis protein ResB [Microbacterium protaetiae]QAY60406.1 cytochrome c biogenesis protein ResB [Microbacterium protaetiae]